MDNLISNGRSVDQVGQDSTDQRIREGFPNQRLVVLPSGVRNRCSNLPLVKQLYVTHIGSYPLAPHHFVERETGARQAILIYCLSGLGQLQLEDKEFKVDKGSAILIPPNQPHVYFADRQDPWSIFWIHFSGTQVSEVSTALSENPGNPVVHVPDTRLVLQAFEEVYACLNYNYSDSGLLSMSSKLMNLFSIIRLHRRHRHPRRQAAENSVLSTIKFMRQHLDMNLTLDDLAAQSGQSIPYYCRRFKEGTDQSPMSYFIHLKLQKACELLIQTDLSVKDVAEELGYKDPYYFSRLFKKIQGCAPSQYREHQ